MNKIQERAKGWYELTNSGKIELQILIEEDNQQR